MFSGGLPITALLFLMTMGLSNNLGNFIKKSISSSSPKFSLLRLLFLYSSSPVLKISLMGNPSFASKFLTSVLESLLARYRIIVGSIFLPLIMFKKRRLDSPRKTVVFIGQPHYWMGAYPRNIQKIFYSKHYFHQKTHKHGKVVFKNKTIYNAMYLEIDRSPVSA